MTYTKNIMMVLIAVFMVIAFAMPVMAIDENETFDSSVVTEDIVTPEITPESTQTPEGVWHNDNYYTYEDYLKMVNGATVIYNSKTGVASKIRDTTPVVPDYSKQGNVVFIVRAGGSAQDLNVWVKDVTNTTIPAFDYTYNPDKSMIDGQNIGYDQYKILPDGQSDLLPFPAGKYVAYMQNGNGGQPEVQEFIVGNGDTTRVVFLGHAVSSVASAVCQREIVSAEYGAFETVCEDVTYTSKYWKPGYHMEYRYRIGSYSHHHCDYSHSEWSEWADVFEQTRSSPHCIQTEMRWAKHTQSCETIGGSVDVTQNVRDVVAAGHLSLLFDNRPAIGGIFATDGTTLLSEIGDPAPGIVKQVSITYKDCAGMEQTVNVEEYQVINLI